jgi:HEAT repeat protein
MSLEKRRNLLIGLLRDPDEAVRLAAAASLESLESCQEFSQILENLRSDKRGQRIKAIFAMEKVLGTEVFPHLINLLKDPDPDIRSSAVQVLGSKAHPNSLNSLVRHLKDPAPAVRVHTAEALGRFKDARLVPYLSAVLNNEDEQLVVSAVNSLAAINVPEAVAPVLSLVNDRRPIVRRAVAEAMGKLPL